MTALAGPPPAADDDADRCREAARLRRDHAGWVIIWLTPAREFRAYRRLPGRRRDTALTAATAGDLAELISRAEQAARRKPPGHPVPATRGDQPT